MAGEEANRLADTARWIAGYRALDSERSPAGQAPLDPYAHLLATEQGSRMVASLPSRRATGWAIAARTRILDDALRTAIGQDGCDTVINLGAGLDTRPQRLCLPRPVRWIEVDRAGLLAYKASRLPPPLPCYQLESIELDLRDADSRRALLLRAGAEAERLLVMSEGFVVYWPREQVAELARDLALCHVQTWLLDLIAPDVLRRLQKRWSGPDHDVGQRLVFAPEEGSRFFEPYGWRTMTFWPLVSDLIASGRAPGLLRKFLTDPGTHDGSRSNSNRWTGVVRLERDEQGERDE